MKATKTCRENYGGARSLAFQRDWGDERDDEAVNLVRWRMWIGSLHGAQTLIIRASESAELIANVPAGTAAKVSRLSEWKTIPDPNATPMLERRTSRSCKPCASAGWFLPRNLSIRCRMGLMGRPGDFVILDRSS